MNCMRGNGVHWFKLIRVRFVPMFPCAGIYRGSRYCRDRVDALPSKNLFLDSLTSITANFNWRKQLALDLDSITLLPTWR
jgi:hypothetical protein